MTFASWLLLLNSLTLYVRRVGWGSAVDSGSGSGFGGWEVSRLLVISHTPDAKESESSAPPPPSLPPPIPIGVRIRTLYTRHSMTHTKTITKYNTN